MRSKTQCLFLHVFILTTLIFPGCSFKSQNIRLENKTILTENMIINFPQIWLKVMIAE